MKQLLLVFSLFISINAFCQQDTIYLRDRIIVCEVKEVGTEEIVFVYPGESIINRIYKNTIQKIAYKSGRKEQFAQELNINPVNNVKDYEKVSIATYENEVAGLYKIGDVSAKARGTTEFSNQDRVKNRAYAKVKIMAAMMGANVIYITYQTSSGSNWEHEIAAQTNITGVAYATTIPKYEEFMQYLESKDYKSARLTKTDIKTLHSSGSNYNTDSVNKSKFTIETITQENNSIMINDLYRVVRYDDEGFELYHQDKTTRINFKVKFDKANNSI